MKKRDLLADPNSCLNRALDDEEVFVLLGRDVAAPFTILEWIKQRVWRLKNKPDDEQLAEAEACANAMNHQREEIRLKLAAEFQPEGASHE